MRSGLAWVAGCIAFLAMAAAAAQAPQGFPVVTATLHPTSDEGTPPGFAEDSPLLRAAQGPAGQVPFMPILGAVGAAANERSWLSESIGGATYGLPADAVATVPFAPVHVAAVGTFTVEVHATDAQGRHTLLGATQRTFNLPRLVAADETFQVPLAGGTLGRGEAVRLVLRADALDVLAVVHYGEGSATRLSLAYQLLDTDGDGIPDDADDCPKEADCDGNDVQDGDEYHITHGSTTQSFQDHYNTTVGMAPPGGAGAPGGPDAPTAPPPVPAAATESPVPGREARQLGRIEATAGGLALATGSTLTSLVLLRRRP